MLQLLLHAVRVLMEHGAARQQPAQQEEAEEKEQQQTSEEEEQPEEPAAAAARSVGLPELLSAVQELGKVRQHTCNDDEAAHQLTGFAPGCRTAAAVPCSTGSTAACLKLTARLSGPHSSLWPPLPALLGQVDQHAAQYSHLRCHPDSGAEGSHMEYVGIEMSLADACCV